MIIFQRILALAATPSNTTNKESIINCVDDKEMANKAKPDSEAEHETKDTKERRAPFYHQLGNISFFFFFSVFFFSFSFCKSKKKSGTTGNNLDA